MIQMFGRPVLTAALLRTLDPTTTVAGWQVASSFSYILVALTYNIYHVVVVFVKDARSFRQIQSFCQGLRLIGFLLIGMVSGIPQLGTYIFEQVIGSPPDVSRKAVRTPEDSLVLGPRPHAYFPCCTAFSVNIERTVIVFD